MIASWKLALVGLAGVVVGGASGNVGRVQDGPRAYLIAEVQVADSAAYRPYVQRTGPIVANYGGRYLVRGGQTDSIEGARPAGRVAVIEFPSMAALQKFERSPEYAEVRPIRHRAATSRIFAVEGVATR